jgi:hypothetical protein
MESHQREEIVTLKDWLKLHRYTQAQFQAMLNPPPEAGNLNRWINGRVMISLPRAIEIQAITKGKVKPADWLTEK